MDIDATHEVPLKNVAQPRRASSVRWRILAIVMAIMAVTALNRLNLSIAGKLIAEEFSFDPISMALIFNGFLWGYGLFQIPWGYILSLIHI